ncbi:hypothetical protein P8C59_001341 [Phyllachora maydis]|uniref:Amidohydrolase-related domain-containing protein n=1 Tax=Phyllachora maydis TaxID=1825666 RepID=A0AAD9M7Q3_9PEZI|nr:hypothetical protein P8C59_001341 [Phyllachora maydis]
MSTTTTSPDPYEAPDPAAVPLAQRLPPDAWDAHMHVLDPLRFPPQPTALYRPAAAPVARAAAFEQAVLGGIRHVAVVQPSIHGTDNGCVLDALRAWPGATGGGRAVGVVVLDPDVDDDPATLRAWHALGVRGVRLNLQSVGAGADGALEGLERALRTVAARVRGLGWAVQVYVPLGLVTALEGVVPQLGVRAFVIDHMGHPTLPDGASGEGYDPYALPGFAALVRLLQGTETMTFVKLSAPYRISRRRGEPGGLAFDHVDPVVKELLRVAGRSRVVFASDFPHTRFEGLDIRPWVHKVLDFCGHDGDLVESLFRDNARLLWGV